MSIFGIFGGEDEPWRKLVEQELVEAINEDTGELVEIRPTQRDPNAAEGLLIGFSYRDGGGSGSKRAILCWRAFTNNEMIYVTGYCTIREALRTFRTDRMKDVKELRSSRQISDPCNYFARLAEPDEDAFEHLEFDPDKVVGNFDYRAWQERYEKRSRAQALTIHGLRVLAHVALVDGSDTEVEREVIRTYIIERLGDLGTDAEIVDELLSTARSLAPSSRSFSIAVGTVAEGDRGNLELLSRKVLDLAKADGKADPGETAVLKKFIQIVRKKQGS
jgi:uncharacterized tellurite resistance protein B-like protein